MIKEKLGIDLHTLGFSENCIVETIAVTKNPDGSYNPAPMGVINRGNYLELHPFVSSNTYRNLTLSSQVSINLTDDPLLFLRTAFKEELSYKQNIDGLILQDSDATIIAEKQKIINNSALKAKIQVKPSKVFVHNHTPTVYSRGRAMAIEVIIHSTRIKVFAKNGEYKQVEVLLDKISECFSVIEKVSDSGSRQKEVVNVLRELFETWGYRYND